MFKDKTLLITGGTGSFGNEIVKTFLETEIKEIRIFSRDEKKQDDMRKLYHSEKLKFYIGDVRSYDSIRDALDKVNFVFHAAALKQVPSCEFFPLEAVKTNVIGTSNVLRACKEMKVQKVVCLSTDKAAYPVNAMGISKALMEKVLIAEARNTNSNETMICGTRYGNVMNSRGSVIPLFIQQILSGNSITVTDPDMTRFIMSLEEARKLVLYAFENATPGDIMIQKAPSAKIGDLARALKELFGSKSEIVIIGSRHGEKKHEVLMTKEEAARAEDFGDFYRIPSDNRDLNYEKYLSSGSTKITEAIEYSSNNSKILTIEEIKIKLLESSDIRDLLKQGN